MAEPSNGFREAAAGLDRAVERLENKVDQVTSKLESKIDTHTEKMEAKVELVQAEVRLSEVRRGELYSTRREVEEKVKGVSDRIDKEVTPQILDNKKDIKSINDRLNNMMLMIILTLITTLVALLQTIFRFIPGAH